MKLRSLLAAATILAMPLAAHAQPVTGPYVSLGAGTSLLPSTKYQFQGSGDYGRFNWSPSYAGVADAGYGFGNGLRLEASFDFDRNTISGAHDSSANQYARLYGGENKFGPMLNLLYDFNVGLPVFPYVGVGVGYQWVKYNSDIGNQFTRIGGTEGSFAYQLIAGLSYPLPWVPGLSATAEYRFMQLTEGRNYKANSVFGQSDIVNIGSETSHTFLLGLRYQLFQPAAPAPAPVYAPAPVAAPAPAPAKTYLVFFDWDKYSLTPRATQIIAQAASDSKTQNVTTLDVSGYTDTSGTPQYNQGLSERRAKAVAAQLVQDGVPASEIEIHGYGDTHLLVPTGPGVREPQNRRVEIVLK